MILKSKPTEQKTDNPENWPQTEQVFDKPKVDFDHHDWRQEGYQIIDSCPNCPEQAVSIPYGKMLVKKGGRYQIVDEGRS